MAGDAFHFGLQLVRSDWPLPVIFQHLGVAQIVCDSVFDLRLRHHRIERGLGIRAASRPDTMTPVNLFNRSLVGYALCKSESSLPGWLQLAQCKRNYADSRNQKEVKRGSKNMRFDALVELRQHKPIRAVDVRLSCKKKSRLFLSFFEKQPPGKELPSVARAAPSSTISKGEPR